MDDTAISVPLVEHDDGIPINSILIRPANIIDNSAAVSFQKNPINISSINVNSSSTATSFNCNTNSQQLQQQQQQQPTHNNQLPLQPVHFVGNNLKNGALNHG